ncbi:MAG: sigma-70 family RNA polymerase sigma factor [Deltaproteobacteria bacterium]|nr:sigma-70 family RNA polymerase sigma factor [Deltaproteobacteria bacterium]
MRVPTSHVHGIPAARPTARNNDRQSLCGTARGQALAFRKFYCAQVSRAMAIAVRVLKDREDAEDVVQETFLGLWKRAAQFDPKRDDAVAWVVTVARSRALDRLRAKSSAARIVASAANELQPAPDAGPYDVVVQEEQRHIVNSALQSLGPKHRNILAMAYFDGLSHSEISRKTHQPLGTVKMRIRLAMEQLSPILRSRPAGPTTRRRPATEKYR